MISRLSAGQAGELQALDELCFASPWSVDSWISELNNGLVYGCYHDGRLVAAASFHVVFDEAELYKIMVLPQFRQQGMAAGLMAQALAALPAVGVSSVFLEVREKNSPAIFLYEKFGFIRSGTRKDYYDNPPDNALLMTLQLGR